MEVSTGTVDLPCFPKVVIEIRKALADPNTTPEQTITIVGAEPRLAARLLQTANSAAFNLSGKRLTDLRSAITRLGHQMVQSAAMAFAIQQMKDEQSLRSIAKPMSDLWKECISVASVSQVVARRTKVSPDEAFLTGLLHGIGRLYIMVRAVAGSTTFGSSESNLDLVAGWHPSIGKAVLENWSFAEEMCDAVGEQEDHDRRHKHGADLSDVLIASIVLAEGLNITAPQIIDVAKISAFQRIGLTADHCTPILKIAQHQLTSLHDALGC
jgi:HD-like signal output (HDOD) protein